MNLKAAALVYTGKMFDLAFCQHCNKNKLEPKDRYFLPNGIRVCKECAERHGSGTAKRGARRKR